MAVKHEASIDTTLAPLLNVKRGAAAVDFYVSAFGANVIMCVDDPDTGVVARLAIDRAEFWVADEAVEYGNPSPESLNGSSVRMVLIVDDPDAVFDRAVAAGATVVWPEADQPYGWRVGRIADPFGHQWEIGNLLPGAGLE